MTAPVGDRYARGKDGKVFGGRRREKHVSAVQVLPSFGLSAELIGADEVLSASAVQELVSFGQVALAGAPIAAPTNAYRYQQKYLFQTAPVEQEPVRVSTYIQTGTFNRSQWTPTAVRVDSDWEWEATHGDYIDANGVRYGPNPALSAPLNSGLVEYVIDATAIVQQAFNGNRWMAMKWDLAPATTRKIYCKFSAFPPRIDVNYTDGSSETLACRITAMSNTSTSKASFDDETLPVSPAILTEFERPSKDVLSATLVIRVFSASGTNTTFRAWLLDPRVNTSPVQQGIAAAQPLDAEMVTHPDVIVAHRYVDGESVNSFVYDGVIGTLSNVDGMVHFDPAIFGEGPTDLTKYPHTLITAPTANSTGHRWTAFPSLTEVPETAYQPDNPGNTDTVFGSVTFVDSSYQGQGFAPLAPGMGALKVHMRPGLDQVLQPLHDGSRVGERGTGMTARLYFDEPNFGNVDDIYVREYFRFGTQDGAPFTDSITDRFNVNQTGTVSAPTEQGWLDKAGKNYVVPDHHNYPKGGFSGSSGGPFGWQARGRWYVVDEQEGGPLEGGIGWGFHAFDIQQNPEGNYARNYNYGAQTEVQNCGHGGMFIFYAHRWYCKEMHLRLNTVLPYYPGFIDDGLIEFFIDGRLSVVKRNVVMRQLPIWRGQNTSAHQTALPLDHWAAINVRGFANGEGWAGVCVRHNRYRDFDVSGNLLSAGIRFYAAIVSRYSATQAVVGLVGRTSTQNPMWIHLAMTDPIPWADGDELRLEARGAAPTVLTVKKNGSPLTLKWFTGATLFAKPSGATDDPNAFQNPGSTALQTATSYSDALDDETTVTTGTFNNTFAGLLSMNTSVANGGLRIDNWSAGALDGSVNISDSFAYADGDLGTTYFDQTSFDSGVSPNFDSYDPSGPAPCPLIVNSGAVYASQQHNLDESNNMLACRTIGVRNLLFNFFHGGQTTNAENRYQFMTGIVASRSYIGPMNLTVDSGEPQWLQGQQPGEFRQIVGSAMSNTPPSVNPNGKTLPPLMNNWNGESIDTRTSDIWSVANGGHNDQHSNAIFKLPLSADNPKWIEVLASDSNVPQPTDAPYYPSGRPCSVHSYQTQQVIERRNRAIRFGTTAGATIGNTFRDVNGYDITKGIGVNGWDAPSTYPQIPGTVAVTAGLVTVKDPTTEDVYVFVRNSLVYKWTEATNTWAQHNTQIPPKDFLECGAAFDSTRGRIFLIRESATGMRHTYDIATGTFTQQTLTGSAAAAVVGGAKAQGLVYVPELDSYLTRFQAAGGAVYRIDAGTFECSVFATTGGDAIPQGAVLLVGSNENIYYRWLYVPQYRGVIYFPHYSADAWFLRTH